MTLRQPNSPDQCDVNMRAFPRTLRDRAKARAASLGLTLKDWIIGIIESALGVTSPTPPVDSNDTVVPRAVAATPPPPTGRRDL